MRDVLCLSAITPFEVTNAPPARRRRGAQGPQKKDRREDAKAVFGEITEGVLFIGKILSAESRSDIRTLLGEHDTVSDGDLIHKLGLICTEAAPDKAIHMLEEALAMSESGEVDSLASSAARAGAWMI